MTRVRVRLFLVALFALFTALHWWSTRQTDAPAAPAAPPQIIASSQPAEKPKPALPAPTDQQRADWRGWLAEPALLRIIVDATKGLESQTRSGTAFRLNARAVETRANLLLVCAHASWLRGEGELANKAGTLQAIATRLARAAHSKDYEEVQKQVAALADWPTLRLEKWPAYSATLLRDAVPLKNAMQQLHSGYEDLVGLRKSAEVNILGDEAGAVASRIVALTLALEAHAPSADPQVKTVPTRELWLETTSAARAAALTMGNDIAPSLHRLESACTACHNACWPRPQWALRTKYDLTP